MMQFFLQMNKEHGTTFIMVTHNSDLARQTQQRIRMHQGMLRPSKNNFFLCPPHVVPARAEQPGGVRRPAPHTTRCLDHFLPNLL